MLLLRLAREKISSHRNERWRISPIHIKAALPRMELQKQQFLIQVQHVTDGKDEKKQRELF